METEEKRATSHPSSEAELLRWQPSVKKQFINKVVAE
jgi:hypothetical protein